MCLCRNRVTIHCGMQQAETLRSKREGARVRHVRSRRYVAVAPLDGPPRNEDAAAEAALTSPLQHNGMVLRGQAPSDLCPAPSINKRPQNTATTHKHGRTQATWGNTRRWASNFPETLSRATWKRQMQTSARQVPGALNNYPMRRPFSPALFQVYPHRRHLSDFPFKV